MDIIDKLLKLCFILSILFLFFLFGFLSNDLKLKGIHESISFVINDIESRLNINFKKKFGDRELRSNNFFSIESQFPIQHKNIYKGVFNSNLNFNNRPTDKFDHYLLIKHDNSLPILMDTPDRVIWSWDLSNFRNNSKIIPYHLFENGDLLIGKFETKGIYRIDKFGNIIWKNKNLNHHWIDIEKNEIFIPSRKFVSLPEDLNDNLKNSELNNCNFENSAFDTILIVDSETGKTITNISLMEILIKNNEFKDTLNKKIINDNRVCFDPLHLNDIRKLDKNQIKLVNTKISLTSENILVLSFRSLDMIIFYDLDNEIINHIVVDLFSKQHSPRLHEDGFLYVFDNNNFSGKGSKIVKIDLKSNTILNTFEAENFVSPIRGRLQFINNDLYVQSSTQGEIFKIICEKDFFDNCKAKYLYSSNFNFFYPSSTYDKSFSFKKDGIYIGDFYEKNKVKFID